MNKSPQLQTLTEGIEAMAAEYIDAVAAKDQMRLSLLQAHQLAQNNMDSLKISIEAYDTHKAANDLAEVKDKLQDLIAFLVIIRASLSKL